ncbi:PadR family transcriptional regulator [Nocardioides albus]|uniref:DNA-binding PadR family transcriptional regulator n=1 Tax=Nocardioides albus TaxID=1841 RepID=A0A7W5F787_9ACTN|nr:PadR family transcriptional regulator [Nocardioides albus]MBB3087908.1 DNA-binding PadR family transcriptional regulator [Nocardioides albus]GGU21211.1 PadR family transcriptional regulator [Nocardioides albus]
MPDPAAPVSNLGFAILGLLARRESTGYEVAQRMRQPIGYFWTARHSQIYPELNRLDAAGLVEHEVIEGAGPRPTKRYRITEAGRTALAAWVVGDLDPQPVRDLEILRLWSIWTVEPAAAEDLVSRLEAAHRRTLDRYLEELAEISDSPGVRDPSNPLFASRITLEGGIRSRRTALEWCAWVRAELAAAER